MIFRLHRQPLIRGIERRTFRHRPRQQHAVPLEAEVVMQMRGEMLLNAEEELVTLLPAGAELRFRLGRFFEVALLLVILEGHDLEGYNTDQWPRSPPRIARSSVTPADSQRCSSPRCGNGSATTACARCCCCT